MNVIEVSNVSKRFLLGSGSVKSMLLDRKERKQSGEGASSGREFWALKDVAFEVPRGAALGIVGHNGSGKSTMLKLLTGILEPTTGSITTRGRIGALIEVGAGFHPDLTGRENVYLNGSILGLSEREITRKFDEIVDFAGLEQFIDTPVKRYSSGMYMRLGFSIAANINPDILIVDEVLAVGDTMFQNKCMKRMQDFQAGGGTIIFVSHAMGQVERLCDQCVWLDHGQVLYHGATKEAVGRYMALVEEREEEEFKRKHPKEWEIIQEEKRRAGAGLGGDRTGCHLAGVSLLNERGEESTSFRAGEAVRARLQYRLPFNAPNPNFQIDIYRDDELRMFTFSNYDSELSFADLPSEGYIIADLSYLSLNEGVYRIDLTMYSDMGDWERNKVEYWRNALTFSVSAGRSAHGCVYMPVSWKSKSFTGEDLPAVKFQPAS